MQKRYLDDIEVMKLIKSNFDSVSDFCRKASISRSHFDGMIKGEIGVGMTSMAKLEKVFRGKIENIEDILEPLPIIIGSKEFIEIYIVNENREMIASITSRDEITDKKYKVEYIPYNH